MHRQLNRVGLSWKGRCSRLPLSPDFTLSTLVYFRNSQAGPSVWSTDSLSGSFLPQFSLSLKALSDFRSIPCLPIEESLIWSQTSTQSVGLQNSRWPCWWMKLDSDRARVIILCLFVIRLMVWLFFWSKFITLKKQALLLLKWKWNLTWEFSFFPSETVQNERSWWLEVLYRYWGI